MQYHCSKLISYAMRKALMTMVKRNIIGNPKTKKGQIRKWRNSEIHSKYERW